MPQLIFLRSARVADRRRERPWAAAGILECRLRRAAGSAGSVRGTCDSVHGDCAPASQPALAHRRTSTAPVRRFRRGRSTFWTRMKRQRRNLLRRDAGTELSWVGSLGAADERFCVSSRRRDPELRVREWTRCNRRPRAPHGRSCAGRRLRGYEMTESALTKPVRPQRWTDQAAAASPSQHRNSAAENGDRTREKRTTRSDDHPSNRLPSRTHRGRPSV